MSMDIRGWVEASRFQTPEERNGPHAWAGVIRLPYLVLFTDRISERLFGISKE